MRELFCMPDIFEEMKRMQKDMRRLMQRMQPLAIGAEAIKAAKKILIK